MCTKKRDPIGSKTGQKMSQKPAQKPSRRTDQKDIKIRAQKPAITLAVLLRNLSYRMAFLVSHFFAVLAAHLYQPARLSSTYFVYISGLAGLSSLAGLVDWSSNSFLADFLARLLAENLLCCTLRSASLLQITRERGNKCSARAYLKPAP